MRAKTAFLTLLLFFALLFIETRYFENQFGYVLAMHLGMLSFALYFLSDGDMKSVYKKLGIPGNLVTNAVFVFAGLVAIFGSLIIMSIALAYLGMNDQAQVARVANELPLVVLSLGVLLAPFSEEFFFRGLLLTKIEEFTGSILSKLGSPANAANWTGAFAGIVFSSLIFGASHVAYGSIAELVGAFMIGAILALLFRGSKSLVPAIAVHFIYNAISISVLRLYA